MDDFTGTMLLSAIPFVFFFILKSEIAKKKFIAKEIEKIKETPQFVFQNGKRYILEGSFPDIIKVGGRDMIAIDDVDKIQRGKKTYVPMPSSSVVNRSRQRVIPILLDDGE